MTENEARQVIECIGEKLNDNSLVFYTKVEQKALDMATQALEEIQQYRALGLTPELIEAMQGHNIAMINDLAEYQALGTVEEVTEAMNLYVAINKVENDLCMLGVPSRAEAREHIKAMARQLKGKV